MLNFRKLGKESFVWLPVEKVPILDSCQVNSLKQPALSMFELVKIGRNIDNETFLGKLAMEYDEMGYFLLHHEGRIGIVGEEFVNGGLIAEIFNAQPVDYEGVKELLEPTELTIINCSVKYPWREVGYSKGSMTFQG